MLDPLWQPFAEFAFLRRALDLTFFPELFEVRTVLGTAQ